VEVQAGLWSQSEGESARPMNWIVVIMEGALEHKIGKYGGLGLAEAEWLACLVRRHTATGEAHGVMS